MSRHMRCVTISILCVYMFAILSPRAAPRADDARWVEVEDSFYYPKSIPAVVYDEKQQRIVMFGGQITVNDMRGDLSFGPLYVSNQMLSFKDGSWSMLNRYNHLSAIPPRNCFLFAWDPTGGRLVVASGDAGYLRLADVWSFDGQSVEKLFESQTTATNGCGALFHNSQLNKVCLLGSDGKLHELQSDGWTSLNATAPPGWGGGARMSAFKVSYSPSSKKLVVFGGQEDAVGPVSMFGSTHVYDAAANSWSSPEPDPKPSARAWHTMTFFPKRGRHVLVGGFRDGVGGLSDVWEFDDASNAWSQVSVENPISMYNNVVVHDSAQGKILVVGGNNGGQRADCIYELQYISPAGVSDFTLYGDLGKSPEGSGGLTLDRGGEDLEPRQGPAAAVEDAVNDATSER